MRRYLVVANQTLMGTRLLDLILERHGEGPSAFYVVVPATRSLDYALSAAAYGGVLGAEGLIVPLDPAASEEQGHGEATKRLAAMLDRLGEHGIEADGVVGDPDPVQAIRSACAAQDFDELLLSTLEPGISRWLKMDLVNRVQRNCELPVTHVYSDTRAPTA